MNNVDHITAAFGLPTHTVWTLVPSTHMNESWIGAVVDQSAYVLRRYHADRTPDDVQTEHKLLKALAGTIPVQVPQPLPMANGFTVLNHGGRYASVFTYVSGTHPDLSMRGTVEAVSRTLAECHAGLWAARNDLSWMSQVRSPLRADTWPSPVELKARLQRGCQDSPLPSDLVSVKVLQAITDHVADAIKRLTSLRATSHLIHGDINPANLLIGEDGDIVTALLDWDECRWDMPVFDLCGLLSGLPDEDLKTLALKSYGAALTSTDHPYAEQMHDVKEWLPDADIVTLFNELLVMLASGRHHSGYLEKLLRLLAFS